MALSSDLNNAVVEPFTRQFIAVQLQTNNAVVNTVDGCGFVAFDVSNAPTAVGNTVTFSSNDPLYGPMDAVDGITEAVATSAGTLQITYYPITQNGFDDLNSILNQGGPINVWWGIVDTSTGLTRGDPELIWQGKYDYAKTTRVAGKRSVQIQVVTVFDRMFLANEGATYCGQWMQSVTDASNDFLNFCIEASTDPIWGGAGPNPSFPILNIPATTNDQLAGVTKGGKTSGTSWGV